MESVWDVPKEYWHGEEKTPNKLPAAIVMKCLGYSSKKGNVVCDPFLGSGQVAKVAKEMDRKFIGFEIVPKYWEFATRQLAEQFAPTVITGGAKRK